MTATEGTHERLSRVKGESSRNAFYMYELCLVWGSYWAVISCTRNGALCSCVRNGAVERNERSELLNGQLPHLQSSITKLFNRG